MKILPINLSFLTRFPRVLIGAAAALLFLAPALPLQAAPGTIMVAPGPDRVTGLQPPFRIGVPGRAVTYRVSEREGFIRIWLINDNVSAGRSVVVETLSPPGSPFIGPFRDTRNPGAMLPGTEYATPGEDYTPITQTVTFPANSSGFERSFDIPIINDNLDELDEAILIRVRNPSPDSGADRTFLGATNPQRPSTRFNPAIHEPAATLVSGPALIFTVTINADDTAPGAVDDSFNNEFLELTRPGANNQVLAVDIESSGKAIVGGDFTSYNGSPRNRIARLNTDGTVDTSFNASPGTGANNSVSEVKVVPSGANAGKVMIGGNFTSFDGTLRNRIARLNADGTLDTGFNPGNGANGLVREIAFDSSNRIVIVGDFTTYNGVGRNRIARLNEDGSIDGTFNPGTGVDGTVYAVAVQNDGRILIAGNFSSVGGVSRNRVARLNPDGFVDVSFDPGAGVNDIIYSILHESGSGKIVIAGAFTRVGSVVRRRIARLDSTGALDNTFKPGPGDVLNPGATDFPDIVVQSGTVDEPGNRITTANTSTGMALNHQFTDDMVVFFDTVGSGTLPGGIDTINPFRISASTATDFEVTDIAGTPIEITTIGANAVGSRHTLSPAFIFFSAVDVDTANDEISSTDHGLSNDNPVRFTVQGGGSVLPSPLITGLTYFVVEATPNTFKVSQVIGGIAEDLSDMGSGFMFVRPEISTKSFFSGNFELTQDTVTNISVPFQNGYEVSFVAGTSLPTGLNEATTYIATNVTGNSFKLIAPNGMLVDLTDAGVGLNHVLEYSQRHLGPTSGADNTIYKVVRDNSGRYVIGGLFEFFNQSKRQKVARLLNTGVIDTGFMDQALNEHAGVQLIHPPFSLASPGVAFIRDLAIQPDGDIVIGGLFDAVGGGDEDMPLPFDPEFGPRGLTEQSIGGPSVGLGQRNPPTREDTNARNNLARIRGGAGMAIGNNSNISSVGNVEFLVPELGIDEFTAFLNPSASVPVARNNGNIGRLVVNYDVSNITATAADYTVSSRGSDPPLQLRWGFNTILNGQSGDATTRLQYIDVNLFDDSEVEENEEFRITLSEPFGVLDNFSSNPGIPGASTNITVNAALGFQSEMIVRILDDDFDFGTLDLGNFDVPANDTYRVPEEAGNAVVTVVRSGGTVGTISVNYSITGGTADAGDDYVLVSGVVSFAEGETSKSFVVPIIDDLEFEGPVPETITVQISNPVGGAMLGAITTAMIEILDNDPDFPAPPAGTTDTLFAIATGADNPVRDIAFDVDGSGAVYIGGDFTKVGSSDRQRVARVLRNGDVDISFLNGLAGANNNVHAVAVDPGTMVPEHTGKAVLGGDFQLFNSSTFNRVVRLNTDGTVDSSFNPGAGANGRIRDLAIDDMSRVIVVGDFTQVNGIARKGIARLTAAGVVDPNFNPGTGALGGNIHAVALVGDGSGRIMVGGDFTGFSGALNGRHMIARLTENGLVDGTFGNTAFTSASGTVFALEMVDGSTDVLVGGNFTTSLGAPANFLLRLDGNTGALVGTGTFDLTAEGDMTGLNGPVRTIALDTTVAAMNRYLIGGDFTSLNGVIKNRIARINSDGTLDPTVNFGLGANDIVRSIDTLAGIAPFELIAIAGDFTEFNGVARNHFAFAVGGENGGPGTVVFEPASPDVVVTSGGNDVDAGASASLVFAGPENNIDIASSDFSSANNDISVLVFVDPQLTSNAANVTLADKILRIGIANGVTTAATVATELFNEGTFDIATFPEAPNTGMGVIVIDDFNTFVVDEDVNNTPVFTTSGGTEAVQASADIVLYGPDNDLVFTARNPGADKNGIQIQFVDDPNLTTDTAVTNLIGSVFTITISSGITTASTIKSVVDNGIDSLFTVSDLGSDTGIVPLGAGLVTLRRIGGLDGILTYKLFTRNMTAMAPADYLDTMIESPAAEATFAPGEAVKVIPVPILDDEPPMIRDVTVDGKKMVALHLTEDDGTPLAAGTLTIEDVDSEVGFEFDNFSVDEGTGTATITVVRQGGAEALQRSGSVNFTTASGGTATAGLDYEANNGILNFGPGEARKTFTVNILPDTLVEGNETVLLELSVPVGVAFNPMDVPPTAAVLTIVDDDFSGGSFSFSASTYPVVETTPGVVVRVRRTGGNAGAVSVDFETVAPAGMGEATPGADYTAVSGTLSWADGDTTDRTFTVSIIDDTLVEGLETIALRLFNPAGGAMLGAPNTATIPISDDDSRIEFDQAMFDVDEDLPGGMATITVNRVGGPVGTVSVDVRTSNLPPGAGAAYADYPVGDDPAAVASGDFNGDGFNDLAVANSLANTVSVLLGVGDGTFGSRTDFATLAGASAGSIAAGLINADGNLDLIVGDRGNNNRVIYLAGNGDGSFASAVSIPLTAGGMGVNGVALADMNRDSILDLVVVTENNTVNVLRGNGDGTFTESEIESGTAMTALAVANVTENLNANPDVVAVDQVGNSVLFFAGDGAGGLAAPTTVTLGAGSLPASVVLGDFNQDTFRDFATANLGNGDVSVFYGDGNGAFTDSTLSPAAGTSPASIAAGDFNGDTFPDLVVANGGSADVSVLLSDGSGGFNPATHLRVGLGAFDDPTASPTLAFPNHVLVADFGGDGFRDIAVANLGDVDNLSILTGVGDGTFFNGVDYLESMTNLVWNSGDTAPKTFNVPIKDDDIVEGDEFITLTIDNPSGGATVGVGSAVLKINDNDSEVGFAAASFLANEEDGEGTIVLQRVRGSKGSMSVSLKTSDMSPTDGWATENADYSPILNPVLTFAEADVTVDGAGAAGDLITIAGHGLTNGTEVVFKTVGVADVLPAGLMPATLYRVANATADDFQVVDDQGAPVDITDDGTGDFSITTLITWASGDTADKEIVIPLFDDLLIEGFEGLDITMTIELGDVVPVGPDSNPGDADTRTVSLGILDNDFDGGDDDDTFTGGITPTRGANTNVNDIAIQPDGGILIGGQFTEYDGIGRNRVARLNSDGTLDTSFDPGIGANDTVLALALDQNTTVPANNGKVVLGGFFTSYNGTPSARIVRVNPDGSRDSGFNVGTGANNLVNAVAVQSDGKVVVGGVFTAINGIQRNFIARLNPDGSVDTSFMNGLIGPNGSVRAIAIDESGPAIRILIGGTFGVVNGQVREGIARLNADGTLDTTFFDQALVPGASINGSVLAVALQSDGKVLIGGQFQTVNGQPRSAIARLDGVGALDASFLAGPSAGADDFVSNILVLQNLESADSIVVGGGFTTFNGILRNRLARLDADGTLDTTINFGTGFNDVVSVAAEQPDGKLVVGGVFTEYKGTPANHIIRLDGGINDEPASGSVSFATTSQDVSESAGTATVTLLRSGSLQNAVTVDFATLDGSAIDGMHYVATNGTLAFPPGVAVKTYEVVIINDNPAVTNVTRTLTNRLSNAMVNDLPAPMDDAVLTALDTAELNIIDDDPLIEFEVAKYSVSESAGQVDVTVVRKGGEAGGVSVDFATSNNTAVAGIDYTSVSGTLMWTNRETVSKTFTIPIIDNAVADSLKLVDLHLFNATNATGTAMLGRSNAVLQIIDDEFSAGTFVFTTNTFEVNEAEGGSMASVSILRTNGSLGAVSVQVATSDGTATNGTHYTSTTRTLNWADGDNSTRTVMVPIIDNSETNAARNFSVTLSSPTGGAGVGTPNPAAVIIYDNDIGLEFSALEYVFAENCTNAVIGVARRDAFAGTVTVDYATMNGSATAGSDYTASSDTLIFGPGVTNATFLVPLMTDSDVEVDETVLLSLLPMSTTGGATVSTTLGQATLTILDVQAGDVDTKFDPGAGADGVVLATHALTNGQFVLGGGFQSIDGLMANGIGIVNVDGSLDTNFTGSLTLTGSATTTTNLVANGDFETGDFTGWVQSGSGSGLGWTVNDGTFLPPGGAPALPPIAGNFDVVTSQNGAGLNLLTQPIQVPFGVTSATLSWNDRIQNSAGTFSDPNQEFRVAIVGSTSSNIVFSTDPGDAAMQLGPNPRSVDVTAILQSLEGQSISIEFQQQDNLGFFNLTLDDVSLTTTSAGVGSVHDLAAVTLGTNSAQSIVAVGKFNQANTVNRTNIARFNPDGSVDLTFNPGVGANNPVLAVALQDDGKVLVGGEFTTLGGVGALFLGRLNEDGSVDASFVPGFGPDGPVRDIAIHLSGPHEGKIVVVGNFTNFDGQPRGGVARLNADGSLDAGFAPQGADAAVRSVAIDAGGNLVLGGEFAFFNGGSKEHLVRIDGNTGTIDPAFMNATLNNFANDIVIQDDGKILVAGGFSMANGFTQNRIARFLADGSVDPTINFGTGANDTVNAIALNEDLGRIAVGGAFTEFNGFPRNRFTLLTTGENPASGTMEFFTSEFTTSERAGMAEITVYRRGGLANSAAVDFATSDGSAIDGMHYAATSGTLNFEPGQAIATFEVGILDDTNSNPARTFTVTLSNESGAALTASRSSSLVTILDDDARFGFTLAKYNVLENQGFATINVSRTSGFVGDASVDFFTSDNTAVAGVHYASSSGTLSWADGETDAKTFTVPVTDDLVPNLPRLVNLHLTNAMNGTVSASLGRSNAVLSIVDNEVGPGQLLFATNNFVANERDAVITVIRTDGSGGPVSVQFSTSDGTATNGIHYSSTVGTLSWASGDTSPKTITVPVVDDGSVNPTRTVNLALSNPSGGATLGSPNTALLSILDNDAGLQFREATLTVLENATNAVITVLRPDALAGTVTVDFATAVRPGDPFPATPGADLIPPADYVTTNGTLTFGPGEVQKTFEVPIVSDAEIENDETFGVELSNPSGGATISQTLGSAVVAILDEQSGDVDLTFDPRTGADAAVLAVALQTNDVAVVGGRFASINGTSRSRIGRLNEDGTLDLTFDPGTGFDDTVRALALGLDDSSVIVGGDFTLFNGMSQNHLTRLDTNGLRDPFFDAGSGPDAPVHAITRAFQTNVVTFTNAFGFLDTTNEVIEGFLIAGDFASYNGTPVNRVALVSSNGMLDASFDVGLGPNGLVRALAVQPDGKVMIGGDFTSVAGTGRSFVARLNSDGSLDPSFDPGIGPNGFVRSLAIQEDGKIVVGGDFTELGTAQGAVSRNRIARFNSDGSVDLGFNPGTGVNNGSVLSVGLDQNEKVVLVGSFTTVNDAPRNRIARLNTDGSLDTGFNPGSGANDIIHALAIADVPPPIVIDIDLQSSGGFAEEIFDIETGATSGILTLDWDFLSIPDRVTVYYEGNQVFDSGITNGTNIVNIPYGPGASTQVRVIMNEGDNTSFGTFWFLNARITSTEVAVQRMVIGGDFTLYDGVSQNRFARVLPDGSIDSTYNSGAGANDTVYALQTLDDGNLVIGGDFTLYNGVNLNHVARVTPDGSADGSFNPGTGANAGVRALVVQPDGRTVIGGRFTNFNGTDINRIARLGTNGALDFSFNVGSGANNTVLAAALQNNKVLVGGEFTLVNGISRNFLARLNADGAVDPSFMAGAAANNVVRDIAVYESGTHADKIIVAGDFSTIDGQPRDFIARLNEDGTLDDGFVPAFVNGSVLAVAIDSSDRIVLGGLFTQVGGMNRSRVARLNADGTLDLSFDPGVGADEFVQAVAINPDGTILIGGSFSSVGGVSRNRIARLTDDGSVDPSSNFGTGANNFIAAIGVQPFDNKVVIGGEFTSVNGVPRNRLARLNGGVNAGNGVIEFETPLIVENEILNGRLATVTVIRRGGTAGTVSVDFATDDASPNTTSTEGVDYAGVSGTLTFLEGETRKSFTIPILDDTEVDPDETIQISLSNITGGAVPGINDTALITIVDNDSVVGFSFASFSFNENTTNAVISLSRMGGSVGAVAVDFFTTDNTAVAGQDYFGTNGSVIFGDGVTSQTLTLTLIDDQEPESNESFLVSLLNPVGSTMLGIDSASVVIVDDELAPGVLGFQTNSLAVDESAGTVSIPVVRSAGIRGVVAVDFATTGGSAVGGQDYQTRIGSLSFADGETAKSIDIPITDDALGEGDETVNLVLSNPSGGAALSTNNSTLVLTLLDDDVSVAFQNTSYSVNEGATNANIAVVRTGGTNRAVSVTVETVSGGSATAGPMTDADYTPVSGTLPFDIGETVKNFTVPIFDDSLVETNETVKLQMSSPAGGATLGLLTNATLTILDNDINVSFASDTFLVDESAGIATIEVRRIGATNTTATVEFATTSGTAKAFQDFLNVSGTLTFNPGETNKSFTVTVLNDSTVEPDESLSLLLFNASPGVALVDPKLATLTIVNDDISFNFNPVSYTVGESDGTVTYTVERSGDATDPVSVTVSTVNGSAVGGMDFTPVTETLNFAADQVTIDRTVAIISDASPESDETFNLMLSAPSPGATLGPDSLATVTILDSATTISFSTNSFFVNEADGSAVVTVKLSEQAANPIQATVVSSDPTGPGGATANVDYEPVSTSVFFNPGETEKPVSVTILNDSFFEGDETIGLELFSSVPQNATLGSPSTATLTILDNDSVFAFASTNVVVNENASAAEVSVNIRRTGDTNGTVFVDYNTFDETALAGEDYLAQSQTLTFGPGDTNQVVAISIVNDVAVEGSESFTLVLSVTAGPDPEATVGDPAFMTVTIADDDVLEISPAGFTVVSESIEPNNGKVDPGEEVTLGFALQNTGNVNTTNVFATLLATGGISTNSPQVRQYGELVNSVRDGGPPKTNEFTFTANSSTTVTATLQLEDRTDGTTTNDLGTVSFAIEVGNALSFTNASPISIPGTISVPGAGVASPYPSIITVSNMTGTVNTLTLTLRGLRHTYPDDIDVLLVSPSGKSAILMADAGGSTAVTDLNVTIDDSAGMALPDEGALSTGKFRSANHAGEDNFPSPAPDAPHGADTSAFAGDPADGDWSLYIVDDTGNDTGLAAGGWSLTVSTVLSSGTDLAVGGATTPEPVVVSNPLTYTLVVTNLGPNTAAGVVLTNLLAPGVVFDSASSTQGSAANSGSLVTATIGSMGVGSEVTVTINATAPDSPGTISGTVGVSSNTADSAQGNNSATVTTTVNGVTVNYMPPSSMPGGEFGLMVLGTMGRTYVIETSDDLTNWTPVYTNMAVNGVIEYLDENASTMERRFYRTVEK